MAPTRSTVAGALRAGATPSSRRIPRSVARTPFARVGLAFVVGGAVGNLIDRVSVGYVLDFVDVYWRGWHFWAFNVADAAISVGASLLILDMLLVNRHVSSAA